MKRINVKLSERTQEHLEVLTDDLLTDMKNESLRELKWIIREAFIEGIIHCADLHIRMEKRKSVARAVRA